MKPSEIDAPTEDRNGASLHGAFRPSHCPPTLPTALMDPLDLPTRPARRPVGWTAPGPRPAGVRGALDLMPGTDEERSLLTGEFQLLQLVRGHRWSTDDLVTAHVARQTAHELAPRAVGDQAEEPMRFLDLGCGIGSVLLMNAWSLPRSFGVGVEAQPRSAAMARRSARFNGVDGRITVHDGDLRDPEVLSRIDTHSFMLVTGTPPYFRDGEGVQSTVDQRGPCRFEHRGGVEDYALAAARWLHPEGRAVLCAGALERGRASEGFARAGLALVRHVEVIPRALKQPLIDVYVLRRAGETPDELRRETLVVRGEDSQWTVDFLALREEMGLPPAPAR
jgi:tRNA1Val (adenine37-N6)-methyltransferase